MKNKTKVSKIAQKRQENKDKLVNDVVNMLMDDIYNYKKTISELLYEVFSKCTQKDLKTWL